MVKCRSICLIVLRVKRRRDVRKKVSRSINFPIIVPFSFLSEDNVKDKIVKKICV